VKSWKEWDEWIEQQIDAVLSAKTGKKSPARRPKESFEQTLEHLDRIEKRCHPEVEEAIEHYIAHGNWPELSPPAAFCLLMRLYSAGLFVQRMLVPLPVGGPPPAISRVTDDGVVLWLLSSAWGPIVRGEELKREALYFAKNLSLYGIERLDDEEEQKKH
jgi:hypothetical protein